MFYYKEESSKIGNVQSKNSLVPSPTYDNPPLSPHSPRTTPLGPYPRSNIIFKPFVPNLNERINEIHTPPPFCTLGYKKRVVKCVDFLIDLVTFCRFQSQVYSNFDRKNCTIESVRSELENLVLTGKIRIFFHKVLSPRMQYLIAQEIHFVNEMRNDEKLQVVFNVKDMKMAFNKFIKPVGLGMELEYLDYTYVAQYEHIYFRVKQLTQKNLLRVTKRINFETLANFKQLKFVLSLRPFIDKFRELASIRGKDSYKYYQAMIHFSKMESDQMYLMSHVH